MEIKLTDKYVDMVNEVLAKLSGTDRRLFMASIVLIQGRGGALQAHEKLGWDRTTVRKGVRELQSGIVCEDAFHMRGRKPAEDRLTNLARDLRCMAEASSQTDPTFRTTQMYRRLTAKEARRRLIEELGYKAEEVPSERSLRRKLTALGFKPRRVAKSKPLRKVPETDAIFEAVHRINKEADSDLGTVRVSIDTKTVVPIGNLSRGSKSRRPQQALDHDLEPEAKLTPFGIHRPDTAETWLCFSTGSVTADFMADRLQEIWPTLKKTVILRIPL
jgi:Rhodopirellula transposase DDE domain